MASNLTGLFAQLNNTIRQNPLAQTGVGDLPQDNMNPLLAGAFSNLSQMMGGPDVRPTAALKQRIQQLDPTQPQDQQELIQLVSKISGPAAGLQLADKFAAQQDRMSQTIQQQKLRESLVGRANKLKLEGLAEGLATGATGLEEAGKMIREAERDDMLLNRGATGRKALAKVYGISPADFENQKLATVSDEQFKDIITGRQGEAKAFVDSEGQPSVLKVSKAGTIWDKDANGGTGAWRNPSDMGLTPAPNVQKVHNLSNKMVEQLSLAGVENFTELFQTANKSMEQIDNIDRSLDLIADMPTGFLAAPEMLLRRLGNELGLDYDEAANAQVFQAEAGRRVAEIIKSFGSGTGLSDADREYAKQIAAGDISVTPEALRRLLTIQRQGHHATVDSFNTTKEKLAPRLGGDAGVLELYTLRAPTYESPTGGGGAGNRYLEEARARAAAAGGE